MNDFAPNRPKILIVDDDAAIRDVLLQILSDYECTTAYSAEAALEKCAQTEFELVVSDVNLGGMTGVEMVPRILLRSPDTVVMMITASPDVETAIDAMRVGVFDYLRKPFNINDVTTAVRRALAHQSELAENRLHQTEMATLVERKSGELEKLSNFDTLTGMPNRTQLEQRFEEMLNGDGGVRRGSVMLVCLSNLRPVRLSLGESAADRIMLEASRRLKPCVEQTELAARFDVDTFAFVYSRHEPDGDVSAIDKIVRTLKPAFAVDAHEIHAQVNIGLSVFPGDAADARGLLRNAGAALARSQDKGSGGYEFYTPEINAEAVERLALESNLLHALERGELSLLFQPKIGTKSGRIVGTEALLRWNCAAIGHVRPDVFIPIAEATGLIVEIGEWVLRTAC